MLTRRSRRRSHSALALNVFGTGNVTDLTRGTTPNTSGDDGLTNDLSTGMWHQGSSGNLVTNGGFTTNTTGWTTGGTNTIARSTDQAKFGSASLLCTYSDNSVLADYALDLTAAGAGNYTVSVWFYVPTAYDGTLARIAMGSFTGATGTITANADLSKRNQWQRVQLTFAPVVGDLVGDLIIQGDPTAGKTLYIDGVQVEDGTVATPYIETDGGAGTTRDTAEIRLNAAGTKGLFTPQQGWVAVRARMGFASASVYATNAYLFSWNTSTTNCIEAYFTATQAVMLNDATAGAAGQTVGQNFTFAQGGIVTVIGAWTPDNFKVSANGAAFSAMGSRTEIPALTTSNLRIGLRTLGATELDGDIFWAAMGSGLLTDADADRINRFANNKPDWNLFPGHITGFWDGMRAHMTKIHG